MWDRTILKANARTALAGRYGTAYAVCLIVSLITGVFNIADDIFTSHFNWWSTDNFRFWESHSTWNNWSYFSLLLTIFVGLPLAVGLARFFVHNHFGVTDIHTVFSGFQNDYGNTLGGMFVTELFIGLWMLLLIVPGIIKAMEYSMVEFILSDNPSMPGSRARQISSMMTNNEKGEIFMLYLSFLGWYALAAVAVSLGSFVFWPINSLMYAAIFPLITAYQKATLAELYIFMRDRAIQSGMVHPAEFGLVPPPTENVPPVM